VGAVVIADDRRDRYDRQDRHDGGRVVPVYALTAGRTRSTGLQLPIEALVTVTELAARPSDDLQREHRMILEMGRRWPVSVAEVGAGLGVPVGVARVLVSDLANAGYLDVHLPAADDRPSHVVLERLLNGLRTR
jgi:hypothetical protein